MTINIPLDKMSASEKLQAIELIWDSLCHEKSEIKSPSWHGDVLLKRDNSSQKDFEDWGAAKADIITKTKNNED